MTSRWVGRAGAIAAVGTAVAQEAWTPRSHGWLPAVLGWFGPWPLATLPGLAVEAVMSRDPVVAGAVAVGGALAAKRAGGHPHPGEVDVTVASINSLGINRHVRRLADGLIGTGADVIAVVELTEAQTRALSREGWHSAARPAPGFGGVGVFSRHPIESTEWFDPDMQRGLIVRTAGMTVAAVHLPSPRMERSGIRVARQEAAAEAWTDRLSSVDGPLVVAGDFNATRWNHPTAALQRRLKMTDAVRAVTRDWMLTWPAGFPVLRIDHVLARGLEPRWARRLPSFGSDHHGILVGLGRRPL